MIYIDTEIWLEGKSHGIGGSEAGIVIGQNPWKSRLELWNEKVTRTRHLDSDTEMHLKLGNVLEPFIAEEYSKKTGRSLEMRGQKIHPKYPFILGNIDREIVGDKKGPGILEIKTKGGFTNWHDEDIPIYYYAQIQHYLNLYDYSWGSFAVLDLGRMNINITDVERDDEFIAKLEKEEIDFWKLVEYRTPPNICPTKACEEYLREHYNKSENITISLDENDEANKWILILKDAKINIKNFERNEQEAKNHLMSIIGNAEYATGPNYKITWKAPKDKETFDLEKFKIDFPELAKKYIKFESQSRRFIIRWVENKKDKVKKEKKDEIKNNENPLKRLLIQNNDE